jgi:hypothetical protein
MVLVTDFQSTMLPILFFILVAVIRRSSFAIPVPSPTPTTSSSSDVPSTGKPIDVKEILAKMQASAPSLQGQARVVKQTQLPGDTLKYEINRFIELIAARYGPKRPPNSA